MRKFKLKRVFGDTKKDSFSGYWELDNVLADLVEFGVRSAAYFLVPENTGSGERKGYCLFQNWDETKESFIDVETNDMMSLAGLLEYETIHYGG